VALVAALAALSLLTGAGRASEPVLIDHFGVWTLRRLGYGDQVFPLQTLKRERLSTIRYRLPAKARQGPRRWYLIHLHFRIRFADDTGRGSVYVSAGTNARAAAQIAFNVSRERIDWSSVGWVDGAVQRSTTARAIAVRFSNYLQYKGVVPGLNVLYFQLEQYGDVRVTSLRVIADSAIEYSPLSPGFLKLHVRLPQTRVLLRRDFAIGVRLTNTGDRALRNVVVSAASNPGAIARRGPAAYRARRLLRRQSLLRTFRFRPLRRARSLIEISARGTTNHPATLVEVRCRRACTLREIPPAVIKPPP
jgi:hypothetical protein